MADIGKIEYRIKTVPRYVITRYHESADGRGEDVSTKGQYDNPEVAYEVAYALCKAEHERLGFPPGDTRIIYPDALVPTGNTNIVAGQRLESQQPVS